MKILLLLLFTMPVFAGDYGSTYDLPPTSTITPGQNIQSYNYGTKQRQDITVDSVRSYGGTSHIEIYDHKAHEYKSITVTEPVKAKSYDYRKGD